jgi:hypothetical protein
MAFTLHARSESSVFLHIQTVTYAAPVDNEEASHHRTVDACQTIHSYPWHLKLMRRSMMSCRRALNLMEDILSNYCKYASTAVTHKRYVSGHALLWTCCLVLLRAIHA